MTNIQKTKEFTLKVENKPGKLAELTRTIATANVNILGIDVVPDGSMGSVRLLVSDPVKMEQTLQSKGVKFETSEVLSVRVPNRPGSIAEMSERLAKGAVDIEGIYGYVGHVAGNGESDLVVKVRDVAQAEKVLRAN